MHAKPDILRIECETSLLQRSLVARQALFAGRNRIIRHVGVADKCEPAIPTLDQVARHHLAAGRIVDLDTAKKWMRALDQHCFEMMGPQALRGFVAEWQRHDDQ